MKRSKKLSVLCAILYWVLLIIGINAAYEGDLPVALFFAITCASENIGISIDHWPGMQKRKIKFENLHTQN